jgi:polysaccharide chain length determinant protein (PEP-CTERM system associated)
MTQGLEKIAEIARGLWRYRWRAIVAAWVVALVGWAVVWRLSGPYYTATAQIYVDTETILRPVLEGVAVETIDPTRQVGLVARQLTSRPNLEQVVRKISRERQGMPTEQSSLTPEKLKRNVSLKGERTTRNARYTNFYVVSYTNTDAELAKSVVQSLIDAFSEQTFAQIRQDADRAKRFVDRQIADQKERVDASEVQLREFQTRHADALPERGASYFQRRQAALTALDDVELKIKQTESRRENLKAQFRSTSALTGGVSATGQPILSPLQTRLAALRANLDQLLLRFTEAHPDVIETRESIKQLEDQQRREGASSAATSANPVYQQLELRLRDIEGELAGLRTTRDEYKRRVEVLQQQIETLPAVEEEFQRLSRDYETYRQNYQALLDRRQSMEISVGAEQQGTEVTFKVIEPPNVSVAAALKSYWLKQLQLLTGAFLAGLGGGTALAYAFWLMRPPVFSRRALKELTGLNVYGVVSRIPTFWTRFRERLDVVAFAGTFMLMIVAFGVVLISRYQNIYASHISVLEGISRLLGGEG